MVKVILISREEALRLVKESSKHHHALIASAIMRKLAERLGEDERKWEIVGLLHDLDYDIVRDDMTKHGIVTSEILRNKLPQDCLYAIRSHDYRTGFKPESKLDKALIIADTLTLIVEKVKKSEELSVERVEKEIERVSEKQPWHGDNLRKIEEVGLKTAEVLQLVIKSLKRLT